MSLTINTNSAALTAHRMLSGSDAAVGKAIERLSSGFRINSAGDDPAGLVISEKLRAQVSGLAQAIKNAGDAVNMVKTAEGALGQVHTLLRSMRDLAVHASNSGANDTAAIAADQAMITNALASIGKISDETMFGSKELLNGAAGIKVTISGSQVTGARLDTGTTLADIDHLHITKTANAARATLDTGALAADDTTAIAAPLTTNIAGNRGLVAFSFDVADTATTIVGHINAETDHTGVSAALKAGNSGTITLTSLGYGSDQNVTLTSATGFAAAGDSAAANGVDVRATVKNVANADVSDASWASGTGTNLMDTNGNLIALTTAAAAVDANLLTTTVATVKGSLTFQVGAYSGQSREISISSTATANLGLGAVTGDTLADVDVTTAAGAADALLILDQAISDISTMRATLGATQKNTFESAINSLTVARENIQASESTIRDTDMASEMTNFTKNMILQSAGISMLAQANQSAQSILKLIG